MPESIQEYLINQRFHSAPAEDAMIGEDANGDNIVIPYREFCGHTIGSFIAKAKRKGWINDDGSTKVVEAPVVNAIEPNDDWQFLI